MTIGKEPVRLSYRTILEQMRLAFPQPTSDRVHDSYFVHSIMRALDQVDEMKSDLPLLGGPMSMDYVAARRSRLREETSSIEAVTSQLVTYLEGIPIFGHPRHQSNVIAQPSIPSLIGILLASVYNPNLSWDEHSRRVALAEVEAAAITARLLGYDPEQAAGVFTFGGTGTVLYGVKIGLEKACPGSMAEGMREEAVLFASDAGHYCRATVAGWLGMGMKRVITVPSREDNSIDLDCLEQQTRQAIQDGKRIAALIATMGTTDALGMDDLHGMVALRDQLVKEFQLAYSPHIHADAVIGWAWSVFTDYDFENNPLGFRPRTVHALAAVCRHVRHLHLADSLGVDFHKTGFAPYISSLFLVRDRQDLSLLSRAPEQMPYLYHYGEYHPGIFTLECSRAGTGALAALANLKLFGKQGLRAVLGHLVEMAQLLREYLEEHASIVVLNRDNFGPVTLFRVYPKAMDASVSHAQELVDPALRQALARYNDYNHKILDYLRNEALAGRGVMISQTNCYRRTAYGEPIVALKSFILSPFVDEDGVKLVVEKVLEAQRHIDLEQ